MSKNQKIATVFGGTGFVGTQVVRELASRGIIVKIATRVPERAYFLKPCGAVGQIVPYACSYSDPKSIAAAVSGADYVVNCVGILYEKGKKRTFQKAHVDTPEVVAKACKKAGVKRVVHISALGIEDCGSKYAKSKLAGERALLKAFPAATILRPSVIFGEGDKFFNMFAGLAEILPMLPLIGGGKTKFQPVYVGDVADAVVTALEGSSVGYDDLQGQIYELGGPDVVSFKEIYEILFAQTGRTRMLINLPFCIAKIEAAFMSLLPNPPLTPDQVESLKSDVVVGAKANCLDDLGLRATSMDMILPTYLARYRPGGRFGDQRDQAA